MAKYPNGTKLYDSHNKVKYIVTGNIGNEYSLIELPYNRKITKISQTTIDGWGENHIIELPKKNKSMDIE